MLEIKTNPNVEQYAAISKAILDNDGYCICALEKNPSTKCFCKDFLAQAETGFCHCGRYYKVYNGGVITLCGSTRFKDDFIMWNDILSRKGLIVFSCGVFGHDEGVSLTDAEKEILDAVHKKKIEMSDMIFVINRNGYIGKSTRSEIEWAEELGKKIIYLEDKGV